MAVSRLPVVHPCPWGFRPDLSPVGITVDDVRLSAVGGAGAVLSRAALVCRLGTVQIGQPLPLGSVEACLAVPVLWEVA